MTLNPAQRRDLKARAHHLHPVVMISDSGLTPTVMHEIDISLKSHELIKIRVLGDDRVARADMIAEICTRLDAAPVQRIGKILVIYRPRPDDAPDPATTKSGGGKSTAGKKAGRSKTKKGPHRSKRSFQMK